MAGQWNPPAPPVDSLNAHSLDRAMRDIHHFHTKFGLPRMPFPGLLPADMDEFRVNFMQEELDEYSEAVAKGDLAKAADALVDLVYVALGTAWLMNLPWDRLWAEVQKANMAKVRAVSANESKRMSHFDVVKPDGWTPPDIEGVLREFGVLNGKHGP